MADVLIRDVPEAVLAGVDAHAARLGLSRAEYIRRRLASDAATASAPPTTAERSAVTTASQTAGIKRHRRCAGRCWIFSATVSGVKAGHFQRGLEALQRGTGFSRRRKLPE